ncbi:MAG TPA: hypothetical protein IAA57_01000 [Candidatus Pullilachnospira intestinigallinarum]|nr:hypothetical protein [Candidatus Pullilachnospira intestinigallinarum]
MRKKRNLCLVMVCLLLLVTGYCLLNFNGIVNSIWMKSRWNLDFPVMEYKTKYSDLWTDYRIYECSDHEEQVIMSSLFEQTLTDAWISDITDSLENMNIDPSDFPPFEKIDYCTRKQIRDSGIVLLLASSANTLYLYSRSG